MYCHFIIPVPFLLDIGLILLVEYCMLSRIVNTASVFFIAVFLLGFVLNSSSWGMDREEGQGDKTSVFQQHKVIFNSEEKQNEKQLQTSLFFKFIPNEFEGFLNLYSNLEVIYLEDLQIDDQTALKLFPLLSKKSTLRELYLAHNQIGANGGKVLGMKFLKNKTPLKILNLEDNQINAKAVLGIAALLTKTTTLESLNLSKNRIGNVSVERLSCVLKFNTSLKILDLRKNPIEHNGHRLIQEVLKINSGMTILVDEKVVRISSLRG